MNKFTLILIIIITTSSCTSLKRNSIFRTKEVSLASTEFKISDDRADSIDRISSRGPSSEGADEQEVEILEVQNESSEALSDFSSEDTKLEENEIESEILMAQDSDPTIVPSFAIDGVALPAHKIEKGKVFFLEGAEELNLENNYFDIPVIYNAQVKKWIDYFTTRGRKFFTLYVERAGRYAPMIGSILEENDLPRDLIFLAMAESGFNNHAKSVAAAVGPWQFMPATGKSYSLNQNFYVDERRDPIKATIAAAQYLGKLYRDFGAWEIATAAYNAGEGKLGRAIKKYKTTNFWELTRGKYLKSETKNYVPKIMALAIIGKNLRTFGFRDLDFRAPMDYAEIQVGPLTDILKLAEALKVDVEEIQRLNPEILRWFTPPNIENYKLRLPPLYAQSYANCCIKQNFKVTSFQEYVVPKKMTLLQVSKKFRLSNTQVLSHLNSLSPRARLTKGTIIKLPFQKGAKLVASNRYFADLFIIKKTKVSRKKRRVVAAKKYHKVKRGESLYLIAKKHKISLKKLIGNNWAVKNSKKVIPGMRLVIR